ncbi:fungal-specific transcription factor domain-containing protein [Aspergillus multicolor]|uniref:fungal specific transcription factor domain-containing protein n=1 Tax=Aspergillus multicolor TaxID=41759 RepID=UPI003CCCB10C
MTPTPVSPPRPKTARELHGRRKRPTVPPDQRKRVKLARTRVKCNGGSPCDRCVDAQRHCHYVEASVHSRRDTQRDPSPVLEARDEKLALLEKIFTRLYPEVALELEALQAFYDRLTRESPALRAEPSGTHEKSPVLPDASTASFTVVNQGKTHFDGRSSYWSFFSSARQVVTDHLAGTDDNDEADCAGSIHQLSSLSFGTDWKTAVLNALPPRGVVDFLAATFFHFAQSSRCYIHPEIFSRKLTAFYNGTHEFEMQDALSSRRSADFISVLFMVFAIGSQFADVGTDQQVNPSTESTTLDVSRITVPDPSPNPGWRFYEVSRRLLPDIICSSSMTSIQVCVLQGIFLPSTKSRDAGYNMLGLALRMAINMGMHRLFRTTSLHPHVRELRNRLWWSVYVAERLFSIEMGRPLSISDSEIDASFPVVMPELNFKGKPMNVDGLTAMVKLCQLMGKIVEAVYCKPQSSIQPGVYRQLKGELEEYKKGLPEEMRLGNSPTRSVAHLALTYEQATMLLTRGCLNSATVTSHSTAQPVEDDVNEFFRQQAQDCRDSAIRSIQIMARLRSRSLLCPFSFHDSIYCIAALYVLLLVERSSELTKAPSETINQGVLILVDLAKGSETAASALRYVIYAIQSYATTERDHVNAVKDPDCVDSEESRKAWKTWMHETIPVRSGRLARHPTAIDSEERTTHHLDNLGLPNSLLQGGFGANGTEGHPENVVSDFYHSKQTTGSLSCWFDGSTLNTSSLMQPFWTPDRFMCDTLDRDFLGAPYLSPTSDFGFHLML